MLIRHFWLLQLTLSNILIFYGFYKDNELAEVWDTNPILVMLTMCQEEDTYTFPVPLRTRRKTSTATAASAATEANGPDLVVAEAMSGYKRQTKPSQAV